jgi:hypothetical protein
MLPSQEYKYQCRHDEGATNWDGIIKIHSHTHAIRDIRLKGVISNMDTKTSERLNGPIRKAYQLQTNFKDVERQVSHDIPYVD